jgi:hypothetical protein
VASQAALALLLKAGMKPTASMMPAASAIILYREGRDAIGKGRIEMMEIFIGTASFRFCAVNPATQLF